ncbi:MAG TPA: hypothetical protein VFV37_06685 [Luteibaculaceae bacterium]|nr:hypothetical protein [Luteibaculaceae bacterium]
MILGIIQWPQVLLIIGLLVLFVVVMGIPKTIREINNGSKDFKNAADEADAKPEDHN